MQGLKRASVPRIAVLRIAVPQAAALQIAVLLSVLVLSAAIGMPPASAAASGADGGGGAGGGGASGGGGSGCAVYEGGLWVTVQCGDSGGAGGASGSGAPGSGGPGGGGSDSSSQETTICRFVELDQQDAAQLGLPWPPPKGTFWALMDCVGGKMLFGPLAVMVHIGTGEPEVTPEQLLAQALGELQIPVTRPGMAPPLGADALVGLPEWYWVPAASWNARSVTVRAGPVWATATATPTGLAFEPGAGLPRQTCAGPGTTYDPARPASAQHTSCAYTYQQPSAGQPGNAYQAAVVVTWRITWTGSGDSGGVVNPGLQVPYQFALPVAQGEALVTRP